MRTILGTLATAVVLAAGLGGVAQAQYYDPIQAEMARLEAQIDAMVAANYQAALAAQQEADAAAISYYREQTGDMQTPTRSRPSAGARSTARTIRWSAGSSRTAGRRWRNATTRCG